LAAPGGLPSGIVVKAIIIIKEHFKLEGYAIASFDPDYDKDNKVLENMNL